MEEDEITSAGDAVSTIIRVLGTLSDEDRKRVVKTVMAFFKVEPEPPEVFTPPEAHDRSTRPSFSVETSLSPKDFLFEKQPRTDVERIACLAFYLTHFRSIPHFKSLDLAKLNTEAAQPKFSNVAYATANAASMGYLAPAIQGMKQLSAGGEQFVRALPDREAAKAAMSRARPRKAKFRIAKRQS
jgi:hypothetical protein